MDLENDIHFMNRPLGQVLFSFSRNRTGRISRFSRRVSELHTDGKQTIETAWSKVLNEYRNQWSLHVEEWNLLLSMGKALGKTDRDSQSSYLQMMREKFSLQERKAEEDRLRKEKLYKNLGILGGLALVLVLI